MPVTLFILREFTKVSKRTNCTRVTGQDHIPALGTLREAKRRPGIGQRLGQIPLDFLPHVPKVMTGDGPNFGLENR